MAQLVALVDRAGPSLPPGLRAIGAGPYLLVDDAPVGHPTPDELLARHRLLAELARDRACLPCRYGDALPDDGAALAWLEARRSRVTDALERVSGRCELDLRLRPTAPPARLRGDGGPGTRYLRGVALRHAVVDRELLERVAERARDALPGATVLVDRDGGSVALLVASADAPAALREARASGVDAALPQGVSARWTGPWPAYTFAAAWLADEP